VIAVNDVSFDRPGAPNRRADRSQRRRQEHHLQPDHRRAPLNRRTISVLGSKIDNAAPQQVAKLGIARTFQHVKLVPDMTVLENVAIGAHLRGQAGALASMLRLDRADEAKLLAEAARQIERVGLSAHIDALAGSLSLGQQRIVEIARALCVRSDAAFARRAGRGPAAYGKATARQIAARTPRRRHVGAAGGARHGVRDGPRRPYRVLDFGIKIAEGAPEAIKTKPRCDQGLSRSRGMNAGPGALLSVAEAHIAYGKVEAVRGVSLDVADNEIVTIIGANGAGQDHAVERHHGDTACEGPRQLRKQDMARLEIEDRVAAGLSLVPEHRELFGAMSVEDNLRLGAFRIAKAVAATSL